MTPPIFLQLTLSRADIGAEGCTEAETAAISGAGVPGGSGHAVSAAATLAMSNPGKG
jgi:hypothetical protein